MLITIIFAFFAFVFTFKIDQITWHWTYNVVKVIILGTLNIVAGTLLIIQLKIINNAKKELEDYSKNDNSLRI